MQLDGRQSGCPPPSAGWPEYPNMERIGRVPQTRELVVAGTPWVVVYRVRNSIEIIRVLHGPQAWPPRR